MPQKLYPSAHILEIFMPFLHNEKRLIEVLQKIAEMDFYRNVELPTFPTKERRDTVRRILRDNDLTAATYAAPYLNEREMSLCDLNDRRRAETIRYLKMQADLAAECGYSTFGVPSGPYPGDEFHDEAMAVQADTLARIADYTALLGMNCSIEPLDRYVHKKALIGPMDEVVRWFKPLHRAHPNLFLHWDSSHEQLGGLGIFNTLDMASASDIRDYVKKNNINYMYDGNGNTDWQDEVLRTGVSHNHNVGINGGSGKTNYMASINYSNRQGVVVGSENQRANLRSLISTKVLKDRLDLSVGINGMTGKYVGVPMFDEGRSVLDAISTKVVQFLTL